MHHQEWGANKMKTVVLWNSVWVEFDNIEEARHFFEAATLNHPIYLKYKDQLFEVKNLSDVSITFVARADTRIVMEESQHDDKEGKDK